MKEINKKIVSLAMLGDIEAFEEIFRAYADYVFNIALRITQHREDAQEITQNVFITIHHKLKDFRQDSSLKTWIYRITVNMTMNYLKKEKKFKNKTVGYEHFENVADCHLSESFQQKEHYQNIVDQLLKVLTPDQRACIILRNIEGFSYQEIAKSLGIDINAVRSRIKRARWKLMALKEKGVLNEL